MNLFELDINSDVLVEDCFGINRLAMTIIVYVIASERIWRAKQSPPNNCEIGRMLRKSTFFI